MKLADGTEVVERWEPAYITAIECNDEKTMELIEELSRAEAQNARLFWRLDKVLEVRPWKSVADAIDWVRASLAEAQPTKEGNEVKSISTVEELIADLSEQVPYTIRTKRGPVRAHRSVYETAADRNLYGITYGGGEVSKDIVDRALAQGLIRIEFPTSPNVCSYVITQPTKEETK